MPPAIRGLGERSAGEALLPVFLTPDQLAALTGRVRWSAQRRALDAMGVRYLTSPSGRPAVLVEEVERLALGAPARGRRDREPRLDLVA